MVLPFIAAILGSTAVKTAAATVGGTLLASKLAGGSSGANAAAAQAGLSQQQVDELITRLKEGNADLRNDAAYSRAGASLMAESQKLRAWAAEARNSMLGVRSSMYGDANPYDEAAARAAADTWYQKALELADQAEAEANQRLAGKAPAAENLDFPSLVKHPELAQQNREAGQKRFGEFMYGMGNALGINPEPARQQRISELRLLRNKALVNGDQASAKHWQDELKKLGAN